MFAGRRKSRSLPSHLNLRIQCRRQIMTWVSEEFSPSLSCWGQSGFSRCPPSPPKHQSLARSQQTCTKVSGQVNMSHTTFPSEGEALHLKRSMMRNEVLTAGVRSDGWMKRGVVGGGVSCPCTCSPGRIRPAIAINILNY